MNKYGVIFSLFIHLIILLIPVSMTVTKHFKEVELFVIDERHLEPMQEKRIKPRQVEISKIIKEVLPEPVINKPEIVEIRASDLIEPTITLNFEEEPVSKPAQPVISAGPQVITSTQIETVAPSIAKEEPKQLMDVEFGSQSAPRFLHREMPVYPPLARRLGKEGRVLLRLTIDENGRLINVEVLEAASYGFTEAAIEAIKKSSFLPATKDGKPIISRALLPIRFSLRKD